MELCKGFKAEHSALELQVLSGYALDKAKESCKTIGEAVSDHFVDITKMVRIGSGTEQKLPKKILKNYSAG